MISSKYMVRRYSWSKRCWTSARRELSVKELPWCSSSDSPDKNRPTSTTIERKVTERGDDSVKITPVDRFGIVAAMSKNRVIGVKGKLPWDIPQDRKAFEALTRDKVLVIGRKTLEEEKNLCHISHTAKCIVISKTLSEDQIDKTLLKSDTELHLVRNFPAALDLARQLAEEVGNSSNHKDEIICWVAGGEGVFNEAVMHRSAQTIHLTVVDKDIEVSSSLSSEIARFPPKYKWDHRFKQVSTEEMTASDGGKCINYTHHVFNRIKGVR